MPKEEVLKQWIKNAIYLYNNGSDNAEYLRGQVELGLYLLGGSVDDHVLLTELENAAHSKEAN